MVKLWSGYVLSGWNAARETRLSRVGGADKREISGCLRLNTPRAPSATESRRICWQFFLTGCGLLARATSPPLQPLCSIVESSVFFPTRISCALFPPCTSLRHHCLKDGQDCCLGAVYTFSSCFCRGSKADIRR